MIATYGNPKFYDKKVQDLNEVLKTLGWIENIYPIARIGVDEDKTFPEVYRNDGSRVSERIYPGGSSLSFFRIEGDINGVDLDDDDMHFVVPFSLTVWVDLTKVFPYKEYDYTSELIKDVVDKLKANSCNDIIIQTDNVFDGFSDLEKGMFQNVMLPYSAFKINFKTILTTC
jgi:hypothetical protein